MNRPTVFIGSSSERIQTAEALKAGLVPYAEATVWNEAGAFEQNDSIFGGLLRAADQFDFAVFVFDADDKALIRHSRVQVVRDNVLFEFGLFTGRIGRGRTFRLSAKGAPKTHIPVDLAGIVHLTFSKPAKGGSAALRRALGPACGQLPPSSRSRGVELIAPLRTSILRSCGFCARGLRSIPSRSSRRISKRSSATSRRAKSSRRATSAPNGFAAGRAAIAAAQKKRWAKLRREGKAKAKVTGRTAAGNG